MVSMLVVPTAVAHVAVAVRDGDSVVVQCTGVAGTPISVKTPETRLWSPDDLHLYDIDVEIPGRDKVTSYFGMRSFGLAHDDARHQRLSLNGNVFFQHGLLDQGCWPDGLYTAPTDEALGYDVEMARRLGFNMIRKHMKIEPLRWHYHCDRLGIIVWQDMPSGGDALNQMWLGLLALVGVRLRDDSVRARRRLGRGNDGVRRDFLDELSQLIDHLRGETCIACWVPFNEGWGQFDAATTAMPVKQRDPSRLVDHASGWFDQGVRICPLFIVTSCALACPEVRISAVSCSLNMAVTICRSLAMSGDLIEPLDTVTSCHVNCCGRHTGHLLRNN